MSSPPADVFLPRRSPQTAPRSSPPTGSGLPGAVVALVVLLALGALAVPVASLTRGGDSFWPERWDPRLAPIAQRDEQLRGLTFEHPVAVRFLSDAAFKKLVAADGSDIAATAEIERETAIFRALGFIDGKVDLADAAKQAAEAGVLAYYDDTAKEIVVRGTVLDVSHRATLAHELTHVLQDQHFDIRGIQHRAELDEERRGASSGAVLALIEGDANHVEDRYVQGLSAAERDQYDRELRRLGTAFDEETSGVPPIVEFFLAAPYELGPPTIRMLLAAGGNAAVNAALAGPTPTSAELVQAGLLTPPPPGLPRPKLAAGEEPVGAPEAFGAFELYLVLATRNDPGPALSAADVVLGGRAQAVRRNGRSCYRATLATRDVAAAKFVAGSLRQWATAATGATVIRDGTSVTFTACDPGAKAVGVSKGKLDSAATLLAGRAGIAVGIAEGGAPAGVARCVARLFALGPGALETLDQLGRGALPAAAQAQTRDLVAQHVVTCSANPKAGLL